MECNRTLEIMHAADSPNLPVTRQMVYARTIELACLAGRSSHEIRQFDYEQAKRELTGESDSDKQQAIFDFNEYG